MSRRNSSIQIEGSEPYFTSQFEATLIFNERDMMREISKRLKRLDLTPERDFVKLFESMGL